MIDSDVIIVGAGPAGSACARKLQQQGVDVLLLDKALFPRLKPCAGWITPQVLKDLEIAAADYPYGITHFDRFQITLQRFRFTLRTNQYAIRRWEFDNWLRERSGARFIQHTVRSVVAENGRYVIDGEYAAKYLVGAGGTHCPVSKLIFQDRQKVDRGSLIVAQEEEFPYEVAEERCSLWFFQAGLPGYAWYVPKANGFVNVGVGGKAGALKAQNDSLKRHWNLLVEKLDRLGWIRGHAYKPVGHSYYLRETKLPLRKGNAFLVGDAAGLATLDMGEGIGPAIQSGMRAAEAIASGREYSIRSLPQYSIFSLLGLR